MAPGFAIRGRRVLIDGLLQPASLIIANGTIVAIASWDAPGAGRVVDAGEALVTAGLVDSHVHVNEPGRTEWEGFASATAAAAAGGVTTLVDMPLNSVPATTSAAALAAKREALCGRARVDVALWGGLVPGNTGELGALAAAGVAGFKCFLSPSGVDEFGAVGEGELADALPVLRTLGMPLLVHAESARVLDRAAAAVAGGDPRHYGAWLASRPPAAEREAIDLLVRLCRAHGSRIHVVHVTSREGVEAIAAARAEGLSISGETCPHYLAFCADDIPVGGTVFKCAPPIREAAHRDALWAALGDGTLALVATDHSPCPPRLKHLEDGDFFRAWGGIASLQLLLPALWTAASARGHGVAEVLRWAAAAPAELAGLAGRKGALAPGHDADIVVWDEREEFVVEPAKLLHRHAVTPWAGRLLRGVVRQTWVRGTIAWDREHGLAARPGGHFLAVRRTAVRAHPNDRT
jgi:allantoinase